MELWVSLPVETDRLDTATMITTVIVQEADISELWRLDILGITDPIEKIEKAKHDENTLKFLLENCTLTPDSPYEIRLPWAKENKN